MSLLTGVRVLDLTRAWSGPIAGRFLADLGADVIHVEYETARGAGVTGPDGSVPGRDEQWERGELPAPALRGGVFPDADPGDDPWNRQAFFNKLHRNKRSVCVDLTTPEGAAVLRDLVAVSDVVLENYSPRAAAKLGLAFDQLRLLNPRIVVVSVSGYGHSGPDFDRVALGPIIEAESGLAALTGYPRCGPMKFGAALSDPIAGLNGAIAVLAALAERDAIGTGQEIDVSMLESSVALGGDALLATSATGAAPERRGNRSPRWAPHGVHRCAGEDEWIAIVVRDDAEWEALVDVIGAPPLTDPRLRDVAERRQERPYIDRTIGAWTSTRTKWEAWQLLRDAGVVAMPVMNAGDLVHDPHLASHGFMVELDQPRVGVGLYPGLQIRFDPPLDVPMVPAAPLGFHNREVLGDVLGYDAAVIDDLERRRVVSDGPMRRTRPPA